jgi:hypothetical protein
MVEPIGTNRATSMTLQIIHDGRDIIDARVFVLAPPQAVQVPVDDEIQALYRRVFRDNEHPDDVAKDAEKWLETWAHANGFNVHRPRSPF